MKQNKSLRWLGNISGHGFEAGGICLQKSDLGNCAPDIMYLCFKRETPPRVKSATNWAAKSNLSSQTFFNHNVYRAH